MRYHRASRARILPVNAAVLVLGLADLASTLFWTATGRAVEVNPLMAAVLAVSLHLFILTKLATLAAYVLVMEWYRQRNPAFVRRMGTVTAAAYLAVYVVSFCCVNRGMVFG